MSLRCSIVVVSRGRPQMLLRCLDGIAQLDHPDFEVIVVACPEGASVVQARADAEQIKLFTFDAANISAARNLGIAAAAGEVVAFIDDDAVPEPMWLKLLTAPLADGADCAGGYVLGRNGISLQWGARQVDCYGEASPLPEDGTPDAGHVVKTEGTNMALRREVLVSLGGFDPRFWFYLDETDLNWRLGKTGGATVLVPDAIVHHGFAASARRRSDRTPTDLTEIGASTALYLREHAPKKDFKRRLRAVRGEQRQRLLRVMQQGSLGADDVMRLLRGFDKGARLGPQRDLTPPDLSASAQSDFLPYPGLPDAPRVAVSALWRNRKTARAKARDARKSGSITSLYLFSRTALYHRVAFTEDGVWEQTGGLYGKSERNQPKLKLWRFAKRVEKETLRTSKARGLAQDMLKF